MPVCIIGMHRSGTSMVAQLLHTCGLHLGDEAELAAKGLDNPNGFWENRKFVTVNDALLDALDASWDVPVSMPSTWGTAPQIAEITAITKLLLEEYKGHAAWGWKDPRNSLTLPFWKSLIPDCKFIVCLRDPLEVALSLHARNHTSIRFGLKLWSAYYKAILQNSQPHERIITTYANYFNDPLSELRRLLDFVGLSPDAETMQRACDIVSSSLRHHTQAAVQSQELPNDIALVFDQLLTEANSRPVTHSVTALANEGRRTSSSTAALNDLLNASPVQELIRSQTALEELTKAYTQVLLELEQLSAKRITELESRERDVQFVISERNDALRQLDRVESTRVWRLARSYWQARDKFIDGARSLYRKVVPDAVRLRLRVLRHPNEKWLYQQGERATSFSQASSHLLGRSIDLPTHNTYDVLIFSIIDFEARYQRPQHLAAQFAKLGHRTFYISSSRFVPSHSPDAYRIKQVSDNLYEVHLRASSQPLIYETVIQPDDLAQAQSSLEQLRKDWQISTAVSVVHLSFWTALVLQLREQWGWRLLYDCMDEWEDFPLIKRPLIEEEDRLVTQSDVVTVTGQILYDKWSRINPRTLLVRNGVDYPFFAERLKPNELLAAYRHPIVGYYGAIAEWLDLDLIVDLAKTHPEVEFVLLGDVFVDVSALKQHPNIHLLGRRPYEEMPLYLNDFDVCLIPFKLNKMTHAVDPVKFYEYMSAGKPTVASRLKELEHQSDCLYLAETREEFSVLLDRALSESDPMLVQKRKELAQTNNWNARVQTIDTAIRGSYGKVSIIIVTYGNLEMTQGCVESIFRTTTYPDYEVVIIDNASSDNTPAYLTELQQDEDRVTVILNTENRGFAAANNQGIAASTGDYIVLLNNDIIVTRGWLDRIVYYLNQPEIGLVGPVTNFCGNEARIEVSYTTLEEIERFAADYTHAHERTVFDIAMLAMFCVGMRRNLFDEIGALDDAFGIGMFEDDDYAKRVKQAGYRIICAEDIFIHHHGQAAFKDLARDGKYQALWERNQAYFEQKWGEAWQQHQPRGTPPDHQVLTAVVNDERQKTSDYWSQAATDSDAFSADRYWLALPEVQKRYQQRVIGDGIGNDWVSFCLNTYLNERLPAARMLSVGCGTGDLERQLATLKAFVACDAYDVATGAIKIARDKARQAGFTNIHYDVQDFNTITLPAQTYDAVWFNGSLHHIEALEHTYQQIAHSLKPDGYLFFNEYVGPSRFDLTPRQKEVIQAAFDLIPYRFRNRFGLASAGIQASPSIPDPVSVRRADPSEAVRSADIMQVIDQWFDVVMVRKAGGTLLQFLLHGIAGNFKDDRAEAQKVLQMLFTIEDTLIEIDDIQSDFVVVSARPKARSKPE